VRAVPVKAPLAAGRWSRGLDGAFLDTMTARTFTISERFVSD